MPALLIKDVRIFDGENEIPRGSVLVENGLIKQVSKEQLSVSDSSTTIVSKPGHTLIPGIVDGHAHAHIDEENTVLRQALKFGVTTLCDMHQETENVPILRAQAARDPDSADFKTCSVAATILGGWPVAVVTAHDKSEEVRGVLNPDTSSS
ncbi:hypothetical protein F5Y13DRAFT_132717 [Hypoxylon sp. FL1857]|nr:hypothetical protein F5Y13DRAFT_132717 [Hypoxylon sp. FL1857]